jgi:hypothetical protein
VKALEHLAIRSKLSSLGADPMPMSLKNSQNWSALIKINREIAGAAA